MGLRHTLRIFKESDSARFREFVEHAAREFNGQLTWDQPSTNSRDEFRLGSTATTQTIYLDTAGYGFCHKIGELSGLPWMELRIQEGSLWDYSLMLGAEDVDRFSTWPEYWEDPDEFTDEAWQAEMDKRRGNPAQLAELFELPQASIENYLRPWLEPHARTEKNPVWRRGKAYPHDEFKYGNYDQCFDFLRALGAVEPRGRHTLVFPEFEYERKRRQSAARRGVNPPPAPPSIPPRPPLSGRLSKATSAFGSRFSPLARHLAGYHSPN